MCLVSDYVMLLIYVEIVLIWCFTADEVKGQSQTCTELHGEITQKKQQLLTRFNLVTSNG